MSTFRINLHIRKHHGNVGISLVPDALPAGIPQVLALNLDTLEVLPPSLTEMFDVLKMYVHLGDGRGHKDSKPRRFFMALISLCISRIYW